MKNHVIVLLLAGIAGMVCAAGQERVERSEALMGAFYLSLDLKNLKGTPIPTDVDIKQPVALKDGEYGVMVLPECKLQADQIREAGEVPVPIGQIWFRNLAPMKSGEAVARSDLKTVEIRPRNQEAIDLIQCALAVKSTGEGRLGLLVYGKGKTPVVEVPLKKVENTQDDPIDLAAEKGEESGKITLQILGRYEGVITVTEPAY
jgi:hypothetical protein